MSRPPRAYKSQGTKDMHGMQMAAMAKGPQLQSEEALANLAAYIGTLPNTTPTATVSGDAAAGKNLYSVT